MDMSEVKSFNAELSGLYDNKPPISKAKMSAITKGAIKAIKFYKHVVHSVEKFIQKCKPEYKVPGLYVIDSIVRQSRHQFGQDKDVFAPRFAKNMQQTFANLFRCPPEDKRNIIRVLNLWQKNNVFSPQVIQPLLDMADPNHPLHQEIQQQQNNTANGSSLNVTHNLSDSKLSPAAGSQHTPHSSTPMGDQFQDQPSSQSNVKFNRKLLNDFEYDSEDEPPPAEPAPPTNNTADAIGSILTNPEIMRQLQSLQAQMQLMTGMPIPNLMPMMTDMQLQQNQNQNLPFLTSQSDQQKHTESKDEMANESDIEFVETGPQVIEIPDANDSRSPSPKSRRRSRSKSPKRRRRSRSRSRSPRRRRDRDRDRDRDRERDRDSKSYNKEREAEKEKQREREKKGLPPIKKENLSVCSTTLWVGHLSKLATQEELSDLFGAIGGVVSIDVVAPRGCAFVVMERRRDAAKALAKLNKHKLHSKEITVAWAPGRGVKGREWKDYWEAELGVSYLPWAALHARWALSALSLDALEDGGAVDEDTLPPWLPPRILPKAIMDNMTLMGGVPPPAGMMPMPGGQVPGGMPPPMAGVPGMPLTVPRMPHGMPPGLPPGMPAGMPAGMRPPSLPTGVPGLQGDGGMPPTGPLLRFHPGMPPQSLTQPGMVGGFLEGLLGVGGLVAGLPMPLPHAHNTPPHLVQPPPQQATTQPPAQPQSQPPARPSPDDAMELDNDDHNDDDHSAPPPLLPQQIQALLSKPPPQFNASEPPPGFNASEPPPFPAEEKADDDRRDRDRDRRERDRRDRDRPDRRDRDRGDRRDRDRDRPRDRDRERDRERDDRRDRDRDRPGRDRRDRDRDRDRDRERLPRDNNNRERSREKSPRTNSEQNPEKSLQERLWEMANGKPASRDVEKPRDHFPDKEEGARQEENPRTERAPLLDRPQMRHDMPPHMDTDGDKGGSGPPSGPMGPPPGAALGPPGGPPGPAGMLGPPGGPPGGPGPGGWTQLPPRMPPPHMPPFRAELRMRGPPRQGMAGPWMDGPGPGPGFGPPRFNGMGPPFNRPPFDRPPFEGGPPPMFDGPPRFERPPFNRMPFDAMNRPPFDGPRPPFDGPRPPFDGPRPSFDGPRPSFDGPRPPFDGPRQFDGERQFDGPPRFDGPPEFFDRNNRRFDDREQFDRGWNGDRDRDREWDRRNDWDDRRRDGRRSRDDDRFRDRSDRSDRSERNDRTDRRRPFEDRNRSQRDGPTAGPEAASEPPRDTPKEVTKEPRRDKDRKSRWGAADDVSQNEEQVQDNNEIVQQPAASEDVTTSHEQENLKDEVSHSEVNEQIAQRSEVKDDCNVLTEPEYDVEERDHDNYAAEEPEQNDNEPVQCEPPVNELNKTLTNDAPQDLYDANEAVDTSFSLPLPPAEVEAPPVATEKSHVVDKSDDIFDEAKETKEVPESKESA